MKERFWNDHNPRQIQPALFFTVFGLIFLIRVFFYYRVSEPQLSMITHVWIGPDPIPDKYSQLLKNDPYRQVLINKDLTLYVDKWNANRYNQTGQIDMLKLLYLYFNGGIYSDFDTEINRTCIEVENPPQNQIMFTNVQLVYQKKINLPEQNFMKVQKPFNPHVKRMLLQQLTRTRSRWTQCQERQCYIKQCQNHLKHNTWVKFPI